MRRNPDFCRVTQRSRWRGPRNPAFVAVSLRTLRHGPHSAAFGTVRNRFLRTQVAERSVREREAPVPPHGGRATQPSPHARAANQPVGSSEKLKGSAHTSCWAWCNAPVSTTSPPSDEASRRGQGGWPKQAHRPCAAATS